MRRMRRICINLLLISGIAAVLWNVRPQACDFGVDGGLSADPWLKNVAARLVGGEEDCAARDETEER